MYQYYLYILILYIRSKCKAFLKYEVKVENVPFLIHEIKFENVPFLMHEIKVENVPFSTLN